MTLPRPDEAAERREGGFVDRCAVAFLSGLSGLALGALLWWTLGLALSQAGSADAAMPGFRWVLLFAALMGLAGFLLLENLLVRLVTGLWRLLGQWLRWS